MYFKVSDMPIFDEVQSCFVTAIRNAPERVACKGHPEYSGVRRAADVQDYAESD